MQAELFVSPSPRPAWGFSEFKKQTAAGFIPAQSVFMTSRGLPIIRNNCRASRFRT